MTFMGIPTKLIRLVKLNVLGSDAHMNWEGTLYQHPLRWLVTLSNGLHFPRCCNIALEYIIMRMENKTCGKNIESGLHTVGIQGAFNVTFIFGFYYRILKLCIQKNVF